MCLCVVEIVPKKSVEKKIPGCSESQKWNLPQLGCCGKASAKDKIQGFPGGAVVKNPPANAGDTGSIPGPGSN